MTPSCRFIQSRTFLLPVGTIFKNLKSPIPFPLDYKWRIDFCWGNLKNVAKITLAIRHSWLLLSNFTCVRARAYTYVWPWATAKPSNIRHSLPSRHGAWFKVPNSLWDIWKFCGNVSTLVFLFVRFNFIHLNISDTEINELFRCQMCPLSSKISSFQFYCTFTARTRQESVTISIRHNCRSPSSRVDWTG